MTTASMHRSERVHPRLFSPSAPENDRGNRAQTMSKGFTLIEMLVVIGIIGIIAAISLPAMKGIGQANVTAAANRQMLDDLHFARFRSISDRTTVYVLFAPTNVAGLLNGNQVRPEDRRVVSNLASRVYGSYALLSKRSVGDQPGQFTPRYLTEWKTLPEGVLIPQAKFVRGGGGVSKVFGTPFSYGQLPFPKAKSLLVTVPFIAFNSQGQLASGYDEFIPLLRGSIFFPRLSNGQIDLQKPDVQFIPPKLGSNDFHGVRINWLTGRSRVEGPELK